MIADGAPLVINRCAVATMNPERAEYAEGHVVVDGTRITAVGAGPAPRALAVAPGARHVDGSGCLATPGLINTHHHLYQWATQGMATESGLFDWLRRLYPVWAHLDADVVHDAALAGLAWLAATGCTTSTDHHYVFPRGGGDPLAAEIEAAAAVGVRFHPTRGSMDLGASSGGLPPDEVVEDPDAIMEATRDAIDRHHDPGPGARVRVAVAPCSPFSVSTELLADSAALARGAGVRLHTHIAETRDEHRYCQERFGRSPVEYLDDLGWLGEDVWLAHGVHLDAAAVDRLAASCTGLAHCPSSNARLASGIAPVRALLDAGAVVGLGVDGAASAEGVTLVGELRQALLAARSRAALQRDADGEPARALDARQALALATIGGAALLGRSEELGSLESGKLADIALWRLDGLGHGAIADPVTALVFAAAPPPLALLLVDGETVVDGGELRTVDEAAASAAGRTATRTLLARV